MMLLTVLINTMMAKKWFGRRGSTTTTKHFDSLMIFAAVMMLFLVLSIEFMIKWNKISGVNSLASVGQLIPLLIGIGGLISVYMEWEWKTSKPGDCAGQTGHCAGKEGHCIAKENVGSQGQQPDPANPTLPSILREKIQAWL
jgi:hypothetical protein